MTEVNSSPSLPQRRTDFHVAIICALTLEADAVEALFDYTWDASTFGKAGVDPNAYATGRIGKHNVVLAWLPGVGVGSASGVAASCLISFPAVSLALVVGICGGAPMAGPSEILLGDVIISHGIVQYRFGRQLPDEFVRKDTLKDNLGRSNLKIRALLNQLKGIVGRRALQERTISHLNSLQQNKDFKDIAKHPGPKADRLYKPDYRHKHHIGDCEICAKCNTKEDPVCEIAVPRDDFKKTATCLELGCSDKQLVRRQRLEVMAEKPEALDGNAKEEEPTLTRPLIHIGTIASGDTVMKSGQDRDEIVARENVIAFEMEGAGVWDHFPGCIVIKGVCDYADSHKQKGWQKYAAATAASCMKAFLYAWTSADQSGEEISPSSK
jgi:nucleoside phosphorylase